jgi:hypothetical protein
VFISLRVSGRTRDGLLGTQPFFVSHFRRLQRRFPVDAYTKHILLYQVSRRLLLLNSSNYTRDETIGQAMRLRLRAGKCGRICSTGLASPYLTVISFPSQNAILTLTMDAHNRHLG